MSAISQPGFYAVPGSIWPGSMQPARAGELEFSAPPVIFSYGIPCFRWGYGTPYTG